MQEEDLPAVLQRERSSGSQRHPVSYFTLYLCVFFYPHLSIWLSGFSLLKLVIPKQPRFFFFKCIFKTSTKPPRKARVVSCSQTCKQFERVLINPVWFLTYWYYITLISSSLQVGDTDSSDADPRAHWQTICGSHWKRSFTTMTPIKMREPPLQGTFATEMRTIPSRALKKKGTPLGSTFTEALRQRATSYITVSKGL